MSEANAATPAEQKEKVETPTPPVEGGTPPAAPAATPAPNADDGKPTVAIEKERLEQLERDAARAKQAQSKADRYDRLMKSNGGHFKPQAQVTPPTEDEQKAAMEIEDRKAEKGLIGLVADPAFRNVLDADPTLRTLLTTNPLAVLPVFAPDALDAEDAIALVKEKLTERAEELKAKTTPPPAGAPEAKPGDNKDAPAPGAVNPPNGTTPDVEYEAAKKAPGTEQAIAGMVKVGLNKMGGK